VAVRFAPAATASVIAYGHTDHVGDAILLFVAGIVCGELVDRFPYPLHLLPAGRFLLSVAAPLLAGGVVLALGVLGADAMTASELAAPVTGGILIAALARWTQMRFETSRPVRIAMIGSPALAGSLAKELQIGGVTGYSVVGWLSPGETPVDRVDGIRRLGTVEEVRSAVIAHEIELLVCEPDHNGNASSDHADGKLTTLEIYERIAQGCLDLPVRVLDANQLYEDLLGHVPIGTIDAAWFRYIMHPRYRPGSPLSKRLLDLIVGSVAAVIAMPLVAIAALAIKLDSRGPVFFRQRRVGEHGKEFEIVKLRTMSHPGPGGSAEPLEVTRVGRVLRRTHINELPQLWNVLRGEMSLVGPRPEPAELVASLERQLPNYERRHLVKPGVTGWAQIRCGYAGTEMGSAWKLCHELYYLKHRSLLVDLLLIVETVVTLPLDPDRYLRTPSREFLVRKPSRA
jgi:lipopolysaccharide/colanic/teichoic acid biosynthesis glycosyltransferase